MPKSLHASRYKHLPALLQEMRKEAGLTQRALAKKLKMNQALVHKCEVGERRVDLAEFVDWCLACGTDPRAALARFCARRGV